MINKVIFLDKPLHPIYYARGSLINRLKPNRRHAIKSIWKSLAIGGMIWFLLGSNLGYAQETTMTPYGILYGSPDTFAEFHGFITLTYFDFEKDGLRTPDGHSTFDQHYFYFNAIAKVRQNVTVLGEVE